MRPDYCFQLAQRALKNHSQIEKIQNKEVVDDGEGYATVALISATVFVIVMPNEWKMFDDLGNGNLYTYFDTSGFPNEVKKYCTNLNEFKKFMTNLRNAVTHGDISLLSDKTGLLVGVRFIYKHQVEGVDKVDDIDFFEADLRQFLDHLTNLLERHSNRQAPVENL